MKAYVNVSGATYAVKAGDRIIGVNRAGVVTITLPTAEIRSGRTYTIKDETGAAASNNINLNYESKSYYSDGTNWFILPITPDTNTQLTLATTVSTQAHGNSAAGGSASTASKGDHKHPCLLLEDPQKQLNPIWKTQERPTPTTMFRPKCSKTALEWRKHGPVGTATRRLRRPAEP